MVRFVRSVFIAIPLVVACSAGSTTTGDSGVSEGGGNLNPDGGSDAPKPPDTQCVKKGANCQSGSSCCSGTTCNAGTCCVDANNECNGGSDCCSGKPCTDGKCCQPVGGSCGGANDCCGGTTDCQAGSCCTRPGYECKSSADCCYGKACVPGTGGKTFCAQ